MPEIRKMLIDSRNMIEAGYEETRKEMLADARVPYDAVFMLIDERDRVLAEFDRRINATQTT